MIETHVTINNAENRLGVPAPNPLRHSPDFASVNWYGEEFEFTKNQAACVKVLWEAMENRASSVGQEAILELAEVDQQELRKVFRDSKGGNHPAWQTMIVSTSKGRYRISTGGKSPG